MCMCELQRLQVVCIVIRRKTKFCFVQLDTLICASTRTVYTYTLKEKRKSFSGISIAAHCQKIDASTCVLSSPFSFVIFVAAHTLCVYISFVIYLRILANSCINNSTWPKTVELHTRNRRPFRPMKELKKAKNKQLYQRSQIAIPSCSNLVAIHSPKCFICAYVIITWVMSQWVVCQRGYVVHSY